MFNVFLDFGSVFLETVVNVRVIFFFVFPIPFRMFYSYTLGQKMAPISFHPFAPSTVTKCKAVLHCREKNAQNFILRFPHVQAEHTVDDLYIPVS